MPSPRSSNPTPQAHQPTTARLVRSFGKRTLFTTLAVSGLVAGACGDPAMMGTVGNTVGAGNNAGGAAPVAGMGGTAGGTVTGAAGMGGAVGTAGAAGGTAAGPSCDVMAEIFQSGTGTSCGIASACHGTGGTLGGELFVGTQSEIITRLLNQPSVTGACTGLYIDAANPAASMLLVKTQPGHASVCPSGVRMPLGLGLAGEKATCLEEWVTGVANGTIR